jgi:LCP family protein required for cell wall assembly
VAARLPTLVNVTEDSLERLRRLGRHVDRTADPRRSRRPGPARTGTRSRSHARPGRRRWPRRALVAINIVCAVGIIGAAGAYGYVQWRLDQIKRTPVAGLAPQGHSAQSQGGAIAPFTMLVIGSDTRNLGSASAAQFGNDQQVQGQRSDSIILVRVVPQTRSLALLSIPRDTLVPIPGYGTTRINAAFNSGNPDLLVTVLNQDFGIQVNHVVEFDFATFEQVADAVGGVEQWFPTPAKDDYSLLNVPAGCVNLTGAQALAFARSREYQYYLNGEWHYQLFPESDLGRIQRQQAFTRDLVRKAKAVAPSNLFELNRIIGSITQNLTVDSGLSNSEILTLARDYRSADLTNIPSYTYPTENSASVPGALDPLTSAGESVINQWLKVGQAPTAPAGGSSATTAPSAPPTTTVSPSAVTIEVENGSGAAGQAGSAAQDLTGLGYSATVGADIPGYGVATTKIEYAPDSLAAAHQVQAEIQGASTLVEDSALGPSPYNLLVVTGGTFSGVVGAPRGSAPSGGSSSTSSTTVVANPAISGSATVNPDSSSFYRGVYVPPGLEPGQTPQTCGE